MNERKLGLLIFFVSLFSISSLAQAEEYRGFRPQPRDGEPRIRSALVIGNASYQVKPLKNPIQDARAVAQALKDLGFDHVQKVEDAKVSELGPAIRKFTKRMRSRGGLAFVYYSGHGMELGGENYLIPIDLEANTEAEIEYGGGVKLNMLVGSLERENGPNIIVLDACRNNPFRSFLKDGRAGLGSTSAPAGTLIVYAAAPGKVAADGQGQLGTFTSSLLNHLIKPGLEIRKVMLMTRADVVSQTRRSRVPQIPWDSSSLLGEIFLGGAPIGRSSKPPNQRPPKKLSKEELAKLDKACRNDPNPINHCRRACKGGSAASCNEMGAIYDLGRWSLAQNFEKALEFYTLACDGGDGWGCRNLGYMYQYNRGVPQNDGVAVRYYRKSCQFGIALGCANLGYMYDKGAGITKSFKKAVEYYKKACDAGNALGCNNLGTMYDKGGGVEQSDSKAFELYTQACDGGNALGCSNLSWMYSGGRGVPVDAEKAKKLKRQACDLDRDYCD